MRSEAYENADFSKSVQCAEKGDVVYCDPTYHAATRNQFDRYGAAIFNWRDQERLAREAQSAFERGALVLISNTYCEDINSLYKDVPKIQLKKNKAIGNKSKSSNNKLEYLVILDPRSDFSGWSKINSI